MNKNEKILEMMTELLGIADMYLTSYCEITDEYVLSDEEIKEIEDEEEKEKAIDLKEADDFLKEAAIFIEEYKKQVNLGSEEECCER